MARKLRFFREQMSKAGFLPSGRYDMSTDINLDVLEVLHCDCLNILAFKDSHTSFQFINL